jgi:hypothetical protein
MQKYKSRKYNKRKGKQTKKYLKKYQKGGAGVARVARIGFKAVEQAASAAIKTAGRTSGQALESGFETIGREVKTHVSPGARNAFSKLVKLAVEESPQEWRGLNVKGSNAQNAAQKFVLGQLKANPDLGKKPLGKLNVNPHAKTSNLTEQIKRHFNPFS